MIRHLYILLFLLAGISVAYSQTGFRKIIRLDTVVNSIIENMDIVKIGDHFYSYGYGAVPDSGLYTLYVIKSDGQGNIIDHRYIFEEQKWLSYWQYIVNRPKIAVIDSSRFAVVLTNIDNLDHEVFCIDTGLNKLWHTSIPKYSFNGGEWPRRIISDGINIYIAILPLNKNGNFLDTRLVKLDVDGNFIWSKINTLVNNLWGFTFDKEKQSLLLVGPNIIFDPPFRNYLVKLDTEGQIISSKFIEKSTKEDFGFNILHLPNSTDYITDSYDFLPCPDYNPEGIGVGYGLNITRRDTNLNVIWKIDLFPPTSHNNGFSSIIPSKDGYYYAFGQFVTFMYDVADYAGFTDSVPVLNSFVTKFTEDGQVIWQRLDTFEFSPAYNFSWTEAGGIVAMDDGGVMVNGTCRTWIPEDRRGWMMRLDPNGCIVDHDCAVLSSSGPPDRPQQSRFSLYPNPASGFVHIRFDDAALSTAQLSYRVYNTMGRIVQKGTCSPGAMSIDLSGLMPGIYFIKLAGEKHELGVTKIFLTR